MSLNELNKKFLITLMVFLAPVFLYILAYFLFGPVNFKKLLIHEPFGLYEFIIIPFSFFTIYFILNNEKINRSAFGLSSIAVVLFYMLEEISYGQHFVSKFFISDSLISNNNIQNELNIHNLQFGSIEVENIIHNIFFFACLYIIIFLKEKFNQFIIFSILVIERVMSFLILENISDMIIFDINEALEATLSLLILMNFYYLYRKSKVIEKNIGPLKKVTHRKSKLALN